MKLTLTGVPSFENPLGSQNLFEYKLDQNYPNPFNPVTEISFSVRNQEQVKVSIFDILGKEIAVLANGQMEAGVHSVKWNATNFASGVYFYKISAGSFSATKKLLLIK